jgi:hypothetical protein
MYSNLIQLSSYILSYTKKFRKYHYIKPLYNPGESSYPYISFILKFNNINYQCAIYSNSTMKAAKEFASYIQNAENSNNIFEKKYLKNKTKLHLKDLKIVGLHIFIVKKTLMSSEKKTVKKFEFNTTNLTIIESMNSKYKQAIDENGRIYNLVPHKGSYLKMETTESAISRGLEIKYVPMGGSGNSVGWNSPGMQGKQNNLPKHFIWVDKKAA